MLLVQLNYDYYQHEELDEEVIVSIFIAVTNFQKLLSSRFHRAYEDSNTRIIREQLEIIFYKMLRKQNKTKEDEALKVAAVLLSWGIYGAPAEWRRDNKEKSPEEFIKLVIPYIQTGIGN